MAARSSVNDIIEHVDITEMPPHLRDQVFAEFERRGIRLTPEEDELARHPPIIRPGSSYESRSWHVLVKKYEEQKRRERTVPSEGGRRSRHYRKLYRRCRTSKRSKKSTRRVRRSRN